MFAFAFVKIAQEQIACFFECEQTQFVGILYVHYFVADVVGSLNKVSQRMTRVFHQSVMVFNADESEFVGNFYESIALGFEETEFLFGGER